jgi:hypothetical protein
MANIIDLNDYKRQTLEERVFRVWRERFAERFGVKTCIGDLGHETLYVLATPGDASTRLYYELVMAVLGLGPARRFNFLENELKMAVVDRHLFLADHVRFEMMLRLGWLEAYPCQEKPLIEMVQRFDEIRREVSEGAPCLDQSHPNAAGFNQLLTREKQVFVRRMLNDALQAFRMRFLPDNPPA